ncbi:Metallo-dependent phosphatase-like protein [Xylariales sp. AK1849]|nr:Metallo-dependent phosphatase-like protein [Xylariales sp. AK1849]
MAFRTLWFLAAGLLPAVVIAAPAEEAQHVINLQSDETSATSQRKLHGRFLHITDFHPDPFYKPHTSTAENLACHKGKGPAGFYGAETSDCDSPQSLVNATFDWIDTHLKDSIDFVIWTGDSARHDSDETIGRSEKQVLASNRMMASKFVSTLSDSHGLTIPVIPTFGNNDILPHNIMVGGPNKWLKWYADIWKDFIPEAQRHTFELGGWFFTEVIPNKLAVFSLNTLYFFDRNAGIDDCAHPSEPGFKQMEWLRIQLQFLRNRGMKAILMGHVPPARTASKQNWDETCWQKYTLWLQQYRDVIVGSIYGHMNIDHFLLQDTKDINLAFFEKGTKEYNEHARKGKKYNKDLGKTKKHEDVSVRSSAEYLEDLRNEWARLPKAAVHTRGEMEDERKKKKKGKKDKLGGEWAERYQLSLVSPSIVPNYFPTIRVFEYNITGLEDVPIWADLLRGAGNERHTQVPLFEEDDTIENDQESPLELRDEDTESAFDKKKKKKKKKKGKKGKKPKDPYLIVPEPPATTAPPGPAYSPQPLTLTGYTQYFANLTHINNDAPAFVESDSIDASDNGQFSAKHWNEGVHKGKKPGHKPKPRKFKFEVEYSTFHDKIYKVKDLTVGSFVDLAYRIGQVAAKSKALADEFDAAEDGVVYNELDGDAPAVADDESDDDPEFRAEKKHKGKKGKKKHKKNKVWLHFLRHAFVSTVPKEELEEL